MNGVPAVYLGRIVKKEHFRTFVYAIDGSQKLVESWDDYEKHMESGVWFSMKEDAMTRIPVEKPKRVRKKVNETEEEIAPVVHQSATVDIKKDDDFLPKEN